MLRDGVLWTVLLLSLALKLTLAITLDDTAPVLDERDYLQLAQRWAHEGHFPGTFRPPLYPAYMALILSAGGRSLHIRLGQVLLSTVSLLFVYRIARRAHGRRAAQLAAGLVAFDPVLVMFTHRLWSETVFIFLLLAALDVLSWTALRRQRWPWGLAGLLLGLAGLTRPMILTFVPFLLPWAVLQARRADESAAAGTPRRRTGSSPTGNRARTTWWRGAASFACLLLACAVVVLPWTARNARVAHAWILVDSNGPFNLLVGSQPEAAFVDKDDTWSMAYGRVAGRPYRLAVAQDAAWAQKTAVRQTIDNIRRRPARFVKKCVWEAGHLWTLDSFLLRHLRNGWYGPHVSRVVVGGLTLVSAAFFAALVLAGFAGLAAQPAAPVRGLVILVCLHATLLFSLTYSLSRYALPLHPLLAVAAAGLLSSPREALAALRRRKHALRRVVTLALCVLALAGVWAQDVPLLADMLATGGAHHQFKLETGPSPH